MNHTKGKMADNEDPIRRYFERFEFDNELDACLNDGFDWSITYHADCVIKELLDISSGIFPYDITDIVVKGKKKSFEFKRHHRSERIVANTFRIGQQMNRICKEMNRIQQGKTLDRCGLSHVLKNIEFEKNPVLYRIKNAVLETLPVNKRIQEEINEFMKEICFRVILRTGGYYIKRDLPTEIFTEYDLYSYAKRRELAIVQERLIASGFFTKMQSIVDNIYHQFMEIGYDLNGGCIEYQVGYAIGW